LLHAPTFEEIVRQIGERSKILSHKRAILRDCAGYFRFEVTLEMSATIVDLFHNSAAGYRAQYYYGVKNGEAANEYAVRKLVPRIMQLLEGSQKRTCPLSWVEKSLLQPEAKLWIHQGSWLRLGKLTDRNLLVGRWLDYRRDKKRKDCWPLLTPEHETQIDLKGAPLTLEGKPYNKSLKPDRGKHIHDAGYT
jgi:hypothetical protein